MIEQANPLLFSALIRNESAFALCFFVRLQKTWFITLTCTLTASGLRGASWTHLLYLFLLKALKLQSEIHRHRRAHTHTHRTHRVSPCFVAVAFVIFDIQIQLRPLRKLPQFQLKQLSSDHQYKSLVLFLFLGSKRKNSAGEKHFIVLWWLLLSAADSRAQHFLTSNSSTHYLWPLGCKLWHCTDSSSFTFA